MTWSQRDNNNYEQTALLTALDYFAHNSKVPRTATIEEQALDREARPEGPAAYVIAADDRARRAGRSAARAAAPALRDQQADAPAGYGRTRRRSPTTRMRRDEKEAGAQTAGRPAHSPPAATSCAWTSRIRAIADALLDRQYWSPNDPQKHPYDDTGWSMRPLFGVDVVRVPDPAILKAPMHPVDDPTLPSKEPSLSGDAFVIENHADPSLITLRYQFPNANIAATDASMTAGGHTYPAGTWIVRGVAGSDLSRAVAALHLRTTAAADLPTVASRPVAAPRIALMHTWLDTQPEGWWRLALDNLHVPYSYISTQTVAAEADLRAKYDVILFAPVGRSSQLIVSGIPMWGNAMPWEKSEITPNLGRIDSTPDIRPGLGEAGLAHLRDFIRQGGLFIASQDAAEFAIDEGLAPGVSVAPRGGVKVVGSILNTVLVTRKDVPQSPILAGYSAAPAVYSEDGMSFNVSSLLTGDGRLRTEAKTPRPTGRGGPDDPDVPQDRAFAEPPPVAKAKAWEPMPLTVEQTRNNPYVIPEKERPQVLLRYADAKGLLVSGLLDRADSLAEHATVVAAHLGSGTSLLFANNPLYRGETIGSYALVTNAILSYQGAKP